MKIEKKQLIEMLKSAVEEHVGSDEFKGVIHDTMKAMLKELQNDVQTPMGANQTANLVKNLPGVTITPGGEYMSTPQGSLINMKNASNPFVRISDELGAWATDFAKFIKTGQVSKLLSESIDADGGYLVPEEFRNMMIMYDLSGTAVWSRATVWPMNGEKMSLPKLQQNPDVTDSENFDHFAGVSFEWVEEGGQKPETQPEFGLIEMIVHELAGYTEVTNSLLDDSTINLVNFLVRMFRQAWYWYTDKSFLTGTGGKQPMGILNDPAVLSVFRDTVNTIKVADVLNMEAKMPAVFDAQAVWLYTKKGRAALRGQTVSGSSDELVLREDYANIADDYVATILGRPAILCDGKLPDLGTAGDICLCALPWYYIGFRQDFSMDSSGHYKFRNNRTALRCSGRVDGQAAIPQAFVKLAATTS
jgi:HK97 family phage major capsid protein